MKKLLRKLASSEDTLDDIITLCSSGIMTRGKFLRSRRVVYNNQGSIQIDGRLTFGFLTNRVGLDPNAKGVLRIYSGGKMHVKGFARVARSAKIFVAGKLEIGHKTYINPGTLIFARTTIQIGEGCAISWNCEIIDDDFHKVIPSDESAKPIRIGDRVWIGSNCSILKGVTIGSGAIIGSRSVVTRDVPAGCLAIGAPAKVVRKDVSWQ